MVRRSPLHRSRRLVRQRGDGSDGAPLSTPPRPTPLSCRREPPRPGPPGRRLGRGEPSKFDRSPGRAGGFFLLAQPADEQTERGGGEGEQEDEGTPCHRRRV